MGMEEGGGLKTCPQVMNFTKRFYILFDSYLHV